MCCDNKCLFFIKVRIGSLIFGYIAAVLSGFGVLGCIGLIMYYVTIATNQRYEYNYDTNMGLIAVGAVLSLILFIKFTAAFTCTILLLFGITKNKPVLVKTYIIYGMMKLVLYLIVVIILFCNTIPVFGILTLFGSCIYTLIIYMVYLTYMEMFNIENGKVFTKPTTLNEDRTLMA